MKILILLLLGICSQASAYSNSQSSTPSNMQLGETTKLKSILSMNDIFLQSQFRTGEPSYGILDNPQWRLGLESRFAQWIDIEGSFGSNQFLYRPRWSFTPTESVNLIDLKGTLHTLIGDIYVGQFRIPWGLWGSIDEEQLWLPRNLLFEKGYFLLRDVGVGFHTNFEGYYMNLAAHNGEGAGLSNYDNRMFVTGQWGYQGPANIDFGVGATAGRLGIPVATTETQIRGANAYFGFNIFGLGLQIEGSVIETHNETGNIDTVAWHADAQHPVSDRINLITRYEQLNPNSKTAANVLGRGYLGGEFHSRDNISRLFVYIIKNNESLIETPNDEFRIIWRITPPIIDM